MYSKKKIGEDNPYEHIPLNEVNMKMLMFERQDSSFVGPNTLYKITKKPTKDDHEQYTLLMKVYGPLIRIFDHVNNSLCITDKAAKYCQYTADKADIIDICDDDALTVEKC